MSINVFKGLDDLHSKQSDFKEILELELNSLRIFCTKNFSSWKSHFYYYHKKDEEKKEREFRFRKVTSSEWSELYGYTYQVMRVK